MTATLQNIKEVGGITMSELKSYQQRCVKHIMLSKLTLFRLRENASSSKKIRIVTWVISSQRSGSGQSSFCFLFE